MLGKLTAAGQAGQRVCLQYEQGERRIEILTDSIIRVYEEREAQVSKAIEKRPQEETETSMEYADGVCTIKTARVTVVAGENGTVDFYDAAGNAVCLDYRGARRQRTGLSGEEKELMEQEGHQGAAGNGAHLMEVLKQIEGDECFYGLGDKTGFLNKRHYAYEMWNSDIPDPQVDSFKSLYKSIPFLIVLKQSCVYGLFFDNTYRTWFDLGKECGDYFFWAADQGNLDYYYIAGEKMTDILTGYARLTGTAPVPQLWTLGYHQSRWSYKTEAEVRELAAAFRSHDIPCDTIHLDIDYMERYKVFTWGREAFPDPEQMIRDLGKDGFKIVTIIDPGVKVEEGYEMYDEGVREGYYATTPEGEIYVNAVWPGDAVYPDFGQERVQKWWADKQQFLIDSGVRGVWNDMNEPASFRGELPPDVVFTDVDQKKADHARMHNVYGHLMSKAAYRGWKEHDGRRPFVITRACYAGTQKYSTVWTGDNHSIWAHLQMAIPQLCNLSLSGMPFAGTDIGGFGSDTTPELLARWIQVGAFSPLMRNHCAIGCDRQEPWVFGEEITDIYRKYVKLRYRLLPYLYDQFFTGEKTGLPLMRPLVLHYEKDGNTRNCNDEFLVGESLLVAPVVEQGASRRMVYLPEGVWYDYWTKERLEGGQFLIREAPLDTCPIYVKAGSVIPNYEDQSYVGEKGIRRLILDVYPGEGTSSHYQDNGSDFAYREGEYNEYVFAQKDGVLTVSLSHAGYAKRYEGFRIRCLGKEEDTAFLGDKLTFLL